MDLLKTNDNIILYNGAGIDNQKKLKLD